MRWKAKPVGQWRHSFCVLPVKLDGEWIWLEWIERRFMGDSYEVRHAIGR